MRTIDIAVCGSGIGGLATALALQARGHQVTIFEKVDALRPVGSGLMLQPTGQAALARLGLLDPVLAHGRIVHGIAGTTATGRRIFDISYAALGPEIFGIGVHRGTLFHILNDERDRRDIPVVTSAGITATSISANKRIISDSSGNAVGAFDLVVDATGLHSPLRNAHAKISLNRPYAYGAVWGVISEPADWPHHQSLSQVYNSASVMIGLLPIGRLPGSTQDLAAFFWSLRTADLAAWRASNFQAWQDRVSSLWPAAAPFVTQFTTHADLTPAAYSDVWLKTPYAERLAFVGDSARAASPQLGQGANLALIDALVLADALSEFPVVADAMAAYASKRHAHTRFYGLASRWLTPFFQSDSRSAAALRDLAFSPMARVPYFRREMVRTLAGLKTGLFTHQSPHELVNARAVEPVAPRPKLHAS